MTIETFDETVHREGYSAIQALVAETREETLHLEFKTLENASKGQLTKNDRRVIARAISGFANAEGGTLVVGVKTRREDNLDVASDMDPLCDLRRIANLVKAEIPEMISPQHPLIEVKAVESATPDVGVLVIKIPHSESRPHMSNKHHSYFRRGSNDTRPLEHAEVKELILECVSD